MGVLLAFLPHVPAISPHSAFRPDPESGPFHHFPPPPRHHDIEPGPPSSRSLRLPLRPCQGPSGGLPGKASLPRPGPPSLWRVCGAAAAPFCRDLHASQGAVLSPHRLELRMPNSPLSLSGLLPQARDSQHPFLISWCTAALPHWKQGAAPLSHSPGSRRAPQSRPLNPKLSFLVSTIDCN